MIKKQFTVKDTDICTCQGCVNYRNLKKDIWATVILLSVGLIVSVLAFLV